MMFLETTKTTQKTNSFRFSFIFLLVWFFYTFYASLLVLCILKKCEKKWLSFINLQERESTKEYVVYLVDASPKMFSTSSSAVSSFSLFFFLSLYIYFFIFVCMVLFSLRYVCRNLGGWSFKYLFTWQIVDYCL